MTGVGLPRIRFHMRCATAITWLNVEYSGVFWYKSSAMVLVST